MADLKKWKNFRWKGRKIEAVIDKVSGFDWVRRRHCVLLVNLFTNWINEIVFLAKDLITDVDMLNLRFTKINLHTIFLQFYLTV